MQRRTFATNIALLAGIAAPTISLGNESVKRGHSTEASDEIAIQNVLKKYCFLLDDGRHDDFANLFTETAIFRAATLTYTGREQIKRELADKHREPGKHLAFPGLVSMQSSVKALAWSDFLRVKINPSVKDKWDITNIGRYHDKLVKQDGQWLFESRDVYILGMENPDIFNQPPA